MCFQQNFRLPSKMQIKFFFLDKNYSHKKYNKFIQHEKYNKKRYLKSPFRFFHSNKKKSPKARKKALLKKCAHVYFSIEK